MSLPSWPPVLWDGSPLIMAPLPQRALPAFFTALLTLLLPTSCQTVSIAPRPGKPLAPGQFEWEPRLSPSGPVLMVVSLDDQTAYVYRNGIQIGRSRVNVEGTVSTGVFSIPPGRTSSASAGSWTGMTLVGAPGKGVAPRLPQAFNQLLDGAMGLGATVVITRRNTPPVPSDKPTSVLLASDVRLRPEDVAGEGDFWDPSSSEDGPVAILLSVADRMLYVYRSGTLIGKTRVNILPGVDSGARSAVFILLEGELPEESEVLPGVKQRPWAVLNLDGPGNLTDPVAELRKRLRIPKAFGTKVYPLLQPGALLIVTRQSVAPADRMGADFAIFGPGL